MNILILNLIKNLNWNYVKLLDLELYENMIIAIIWKHEIWNETKNVNL